MNKLTDEQVVNALECCKSFDDLRACYKCPALQTDGCASGKTYISDFIIKEILDLIKRKDAKIERLTVENLQMVASIKRLKAEAIKEFAEKLKENAIDIDVSYGYGKEHYTEAVAVIEIDNLVEEMVGESNAQFTTHNSQLELLREKCLEHQDFHKGEDGVFKGWISVEDLDYIISEVSG